MAALTPMVCVALLFWFTMRAILNADRRERAALAEFEATQSNDGESTEDQSRHPG